MSKTDGFDHPVLSTFINFMQEQGPGTGVSANSETGRKGGPGHLGGFEVIPGGVRGFLSPLCGGTLCGGFLCHIEEVSQVRRVYSQGEKRRFLTGRGLPL